VEPELSITGRWREMLACNDNTCGESKNQNAHASLLDLTCLIAATNSKPSIYCYCIARQRLAGPMILTPLGGVVRPAILRLRQGDDS